MADEAMSDVGGPFEPSTGEGFVGSLSFGEGVPPVPLAELYSAPPAGSITDVLFFTEPEPCPVLDTTPPVFAGAALIFNVSQAGFEVGWVAGTDDVSDPSALRYRVYLGREGDVVDYSQPYATTAPGATSAVVTGCRPGFDYLAVVRAVDEVGNEDSNTVEQAVTTLADASAPTFGGAEYALQTLDNEVLIVWTNAADDWSPLDAIGYRVYRATTSGAQDFNAPLAEVLDGVTRYLDDTVTLSATYFYVVRAFDEEGNEDTNTVEVSATIADATVDATAPTVALVSPSAGSPITPTTPVVVDVADDRGLGRVIITAKLAASGIEEVAFNGTAFQGYYAALSYKELVGEGVEGGGGGRGGEGEGPTPVAPTWRFHLIRTGGWTSAPAIEVYVVDLAGNEGV